MDPILNLDPEAMRAVAARLRAQSERLAAGSQRIHARAGALDFEGPAASRFRDQVVDRHRRALSASGRLQDLANQVLRRAGQTEDAQAAARAAATEEGS